VKRTILCIGDSITFGYAHDATPYPARLATLLSRAVVNMGTGFDRLSQIASRYSQYCAPFPYDAGVLEGGTNDLGLDSTSGSTVAAAFLTIADAMRASGMDRVVGVLVPPRAGSSGWDNTKEAQRLAANIAISAGAETRPWLRIVDSDAVLGDGASPPALVAAFDYGDHLHLSGGADDPETSGMSALAVAVAAALG